MDDLDVKELLATAARTRPVELHPVHAVLRRRRRVRTRAAGFAAGALVMASVLTVTVGPDVVSGLGRAVPAGQVTARPTAPPRDSVDADEVRVAQEAFVAALAAHLPGAPAAEVGPVSWEPTPGVSRTFGWEADLTLTGSDPAVLLTITVEDSRSPNPPVDGCSGDVVGDCFAGGDDAGTTWASWRQAVHTGPDDAVVVSSPVARAILPDGRFVQAEGRVVSTPDRPLRAGDIWPLGSPVTPSALAALVTDPRLAEVPLP
ncbi:hypothetical protein OG218_18025 [Kineococcus sp. NBC_00420]|uniref:hypothetical protein n=1 Tax=Kineococcus sp. NBC_00420 TaxID=2903564 RepID=UPI002E20C985